MKILVSPFSGGSFVHQVALVYNLSLAGYKPDLSLGTSGGNVTNYIAAAADWDPAGILRTAKLVNSSLFLKRWPTVFHAYFKGSMYDRADGMDSFLSSIFDEKSIAKYEIWTGAYNVGTKKSQVFCNRAANKASYDIKIDSKKIGCEEPIFLDGSIKRISLACEASAAIPTVVPPVKLDTCLYVDGGVSCGSPLTMMGDNLPLLDKNIHLTYLSGFDVEKSENKVDSVYSNIVSVGKFSFNSLSNNIYYRDRCRGIDLLKEMSASSSSLGSSSFSFGSPGPAVYHSSGPCDYEMMVNLEKLREEATCSMIEYYPESSESLDLTNFDGSTSTPLIGKTVKKFNFRAWWTGSKNILSSLFS